MALNHRRGFDRLRMAGLIILSFAVSTCSRPSPPTVVLLDEWWTRDMAKAACESARRWWRDNQERVVTLGCDRVLSCSDLKPTVDACVVDPLPEVVEFEKKFTAAFATDDRCHGLTLKEYKGPGYASHGTLNEQWFLTVDYKPGIPEQSWSMHHTASRKESG